MRSVILNLTKIKTGAPPVNKRTLPRASAIVKRDRDAIMHARKRDAKRPRGINVDRINLMLEELTIYPEGNREHTFKARVLRHGEMYKLLGIQEKIFYGWLTRGKVPFAAYCVQTGTRGMPPKAYLEEEVWALVTALNTHYNEHLTFRDTDVGLRRNIHAALQFCRDRKAKTYANPCQ